MLIAVNPITGATLPFADYLVTASTPQAIAHRQTMTAINGVVYPTAQLAALASEIATRLIKERIRGGAWAVQTGVFAPEELRKIFPQGPPSMAWYAIFFIATILWDRGVRKLDDAIAIYGVGKSRLESSRGTAVRENAEIPIHRDCSGEGCTDYLLILGPDGKVSVFSNGINTSDLGTIFAVVGFALAVTGIGAAVASIAAEGVTLANAAGLVSGVGAIPGVDLGVAEQIAGGISSGLRLASSIPTGGGFEMPDFDVGSFDVSIGGLDLPADFAVDLGDLAEGLAAGSLDDLIVQLQELNIAPDALFVDNLGNVFDVAGGVVIPDWDLYASTIYVNELGDVMDLSNNILVDRQTAGQIMDSAGGAALNDYIAEQVQDRAGQSLATQPPSANRHAGAPPASGTVKLPSWVSEAAGLIKAYFSYDIAREQIKRTGRYTPSYATNPAGSARPGVVGVPVQRADGSIATNNGNGTTTIVRPDGRVETVPTQVNPQQIGSVGGTMGGALIPGVSNTTLLLGGAALLGVLLLSRRRGS